MRFDSFGCSRPSDRGARAGNSLSPFPPEKWGAPIVDLDHLCRQQYSKLRQDVVTKAQSIIEARETRLSPNAVCQLLIAYDDAEQKLMSFVEKCRFSNDIDEIRSDYAKTTSLRQKICQLPDLSWLPNARWRF